MPDLTDDAALAARVVQEAVALAARMRSEQDLDVATKTSVSDLVTAADHAAEEQVVGTLQRERPDDGLLGEEGAEADGTSGRRWIIDPVDGTYNFATGSDYWCSAVALVDVDDVVLGAVAHHRDGVLVGGPDLPTMLNGERVRGVHEVQPDHAGVATYLHPTAVTEARLRDPFLRAASTAATIRMLGSASMDLSGVAMGRLHGWFQHSTADWDWFPGAALVRGAGGATARVVVDGTLWSVAGGPAVVDGLVTALEGR